MQKFYRLLVSALAISLVAVSPVRAASEVPSLLKLVESGALPPLEQRLPLVPATPSFEG